MTERVDPPSSATPSPDGASNPVPAPWSPPAGTAGDGTLIRTNLAAARADERDCPTAMSVKARPLLAADPKPPYIPQPLQTFALGPFTAALDRIERGENADAVLAELWRTRGVLGTRNAPAHRGLLAWTAAAVARFLAARGADQQAAASAGRAPTQAIGEEWVARRKRDHPDARGAKAYEQTAWGRRYTSADGRIRELWLISQGAAKAARPDAEVAAAAYVAAFGQPAVDGGWRPYRLLAPRALPPSRTVLPDRVRIIEFGCGDGQTRVLADWDRQQCQDNFTREAAPALARMVQDTRTNPGSSCLQCKAVSGCSALVRTPHLLAIDPPSARRPRKSISVTDLRYHHECPAKYHLARTLHLKSPQTENPAIRLGRAIDAVLNRRHAATPARPCPRTPDELGTEPWTAGEAELIAEQTQTAARMLTHHAAFCPLGDLPPGEQVLVQHQVACYDPETDVVFIATPDLLYSRGGGWVWRETKASSSGVYEGKSLLHNYPQLALAALMINAGVLGGEPRRSLIELEVLTADDVTRLEVSPSHPRVVAEAREVLAGQAAALLADEVFAERPGSHCTGCEALPWCSPGQNEVNTERDREGRLP